MKLNRRHFVQKLIASAAATFWGRSLFAGAGPAFWKKRAVAAPGISKRCVFVANGGSGSSSTLVYDGSTFQTGTLPMSSTGWIRPAWNGSVFCIVQASSTVAATSPDGITWTQRTLPSSHAWSAICWSGQNFILIASDSSAYHTSADGITWSSGTLPLSSSLMSMASNGSVTVALPAGLTTAIYSSDHGATWSTTTIAMANYYNVIWTGSMFCGQGGQALSTTKYLTSTTGTSWTTQNMTMSSNWSALASNGTQIAVFKQNAQTDYALGTDGVNWTSQTIPAAVAAGAVCWFVDRYLVCRPGSTTAHTSLDGVNWTVLTLPSSGWNRICTN